MQRRERRPGPRGYQRSDERLREEVYDRLIQQTDIDVSDIEVAATEGVITLSGAVDSRWEKHRVEDLVDSIWGAKDIRNNLRVKSGRGEEAAPAQGGRGQSGSTGTGSTGANKGGGGHRSQATP